VRAARGAGIASQWDGRAPARLEGEPMNDLFRELKQRMRSLDRILVERGLGDMEFAQAVSRLRRAARKGDRSREPSADLRVLLERAEGLALRI
jgi:hypothetical protein